VTDYITPTRLKSDRGWTDALIKRFLGDPDELAVNPNYSSGPRMRLYDIDRVMAVEATKDCQIALAQKAASRAKAKGSRQAGR
jgi:hypothetical protein